MCIISYPAVCYVFVCHNIKYTRNETDERSGGRRRGTAGATDRRVSTSASGGSCLCVLIVCVCVAVVYRRPGLFALPPRRILCFMVFVDQSCSAHVYVQHIYTRIHTVKASYLYTCAVRSLPVAVRVERECNEFVLINYYITRDKRQLYRPNGAASCGSATQFLLRAQSARRMSNELVSHEP